MQKVYSGFDWDKGNRGKCQRHGVSLEEIEALFQGELAVYPDPQHSVNEERFLAIGKGLLGRYIFLAFTIRTQGPDRFIRPISARYMHQKEVDHHGKENPDL